MTIVPSTDFAPSHYHKPRSISLEWMLASGLIDEDVDTGCWIWRGTRWVNRPPVYPQIAKPHSMCGHTHFAVHRLIFEEWYGSILSDDEEVTATCRTNVMEMPDGSSLSRRRQSCVNPEHHKLKD